MGFLENNETMAWLNQAGGGCPCQYAGCTDPAANNYNASASVDDGSCTFAPIPRTIYIQDSEIVHSGPLTGYTDPPFASEVPSNDGFSLASQAKVERG